MAGTGSFILPNALQQWVTELIKMDKVESLIVIDGEMNLMDVLKEYLKGNGKKV